MNGRVHVRVDFNRFDEIGRGMEAKAAAVVAKAAHDIAGQAQAGILRHELWDTGALFNSVQPRQLGPLKWLVEVGQSYGIYHEMGTRHLPARPFFAPAVDAVRPAFAAAMAQVVGK